MNQLTACDVSSTKELLSKIKDTAEILIEKVHSLTARVTTGDLSTENGISFLDTKNELLSHYNLDIANLVSRKATGRSLENSPAIQRLIQMRTYIEKSRPIEHKLKYQMEKLIKIASSGGLSSNDPLHLKPNPSNMLSKTAGAQNEASSSDEEENEQDAASKQSIGVYKPPMMSAAHYEEELNLKEREQMLINKAKKRALSTAMMRELRAEYSEAPEEVRDDMNLHRLKQSNDEKHRIEYEEDNFKRILLSKQEKRRQGQMQTVSSLDKLTNFGDISALTGGMENFSSGKKRKSKQPKSGSKKKKRIRM